ncbi:hypothetical protein RhiJN_27598 [Ceratobasidium sp. AG-Ba]|nr:hypothetical protein RhiJN_27598 [Ceratobasidium sp. AG-Ba]
MALGFSPDLREFRNNFLIADFNPLAARRFNSSATSETGSLETDPIIDGFLPQSWRYLLSKAPELGAGGSFSITVDEESPTKIELPPVVESRVISKLPYRLSLVLVSGVFGRWMMDSNRLIGIKLSLEAEPAAYFAAYFYSEPVFPPAYFVRMSNLDVPPLFEAVANESRLPGYSTTSAPRVPTLQSDHSFSLSSSGGHPWLNLKMRSCASSSQALPLFHQGDLGIVRGEISISTAELSKIKTVTIAVLGERTVVGQDKPKFPRLAKRIWNANEKQPHTPLKFELALPQIAHVVEYGASREDYDLPPSFSVKAVPSFLEYRLVVGIKRGRFRLNSQLQTAIVYVPKVFSPAIPEPHLTALTNGFNLPVPLASNWKIGEHLQITGAIFGTRPVLVRASLAVLPQATLAIGTFSPVLIILESSDSQALDLFSTPSSIRLRLVEEVYIGTDNDRRSSHNTFTLSLGRARVWPTTHPPDSLPPNTRLVEGELVIPRNTRPSFEFARFELKYRIQARFDCPGFAWDEAVSLPSGITKPRLEMEVKLVSDPGTNVAWKSRVPPAHAGQDLKDEDFYDDQNVTGVLLGAGMFLPRSFKTRLIMLL